MPGNLAKANYLVERVLQRLLGLENALPTTEHQGLTVLGEKYGFQVVTDAAVHEGDPCFNPSTAVQQDRFLEVLSAELSLYPESVIHSCGLKRLILCQNLTSHDRRLAGLAELGLWELGTLVLDSDILPHSKDWGREVFHHELFHAIDYRDDLSHFVDPAWSHLNIEGFRYNNDLVFMDMPRFDDRDLDTEYKGFINTYAMQNPYEDKAVVYANMIVRYKRLMQMAKKDEIIARKIDYMKTLLREFDASFDDQFWKARLQPQ